MTKLYNYLQQPIFFKTISNDINLGITPYIIGYEKCSIDKGVTTFKKPLNVLFFILSGSGTFETAGKTFNVQENSCFVCPTNQETTYYPNQNNPWEYIWIEFNGSECKNLFMKMNISFDNPVINLEGSSHVFEILTDLIIKIYEKNDNLGFIVVGKFLEVVYEIIKNQDSVNVTNLTKREKQIQQVIDYIKENYTNQDISIANIAKEFKFNASYLSRTFKEVTGTTPMRYVIELRMNKATEMITTRQYSMNEIALTIGYANQFYFSKEFKDFFGISPSRYNSVYKSDMKNSK